MTERLNWTELNWESNRHSNRKSLFAVLLLTMSAKTPGLIKLIILATWYTSMEFSFSSWCIRVVRAQKVPAVTPPCLEANGRDKDSIQMHQTFTSGAHRACGLDNLAVRTLKILIYCLILLSMEPWLNLKHFGVFTISVMRHFVEVFGYTFCFVLLWNGLAINQNNLTEVK